MSSHQANRALRVIALLFLAGPIAFAQTNPTQDSIDRNRGIELYRQGKYSDASDFLKKLVKKNKTDEQAWYYLGLALARQRDYKVASKAFETALKLRPSSAASHAALSFALLQRNKLADALREADAALTIDPALADAHYVSGVVYLRSGKRESALSEAENALRISPGFAGAYLLKSQALVSFVGDVLIRPDADEPLKERYTQAGDAMEKYLQLNPNAENKETWTEQLESLRFWGKLRVGGESGIYPGKEVTTKARVLAKPEPSYTDSARNNLVIGTVVLRGIFAADGTVKHIMVITDLPYGLTEAAIKAARRIKFVPATINGRPVSMFIQLEYNFNLY